MATLRGNLVVGQSGGPTVVINQSLIGLLEAALGRAEIDKILGARHAVKGILAEDFLDLRRTPRSEFETIAKTPCAALGSVRKKPSEEERRQVFDVFKKYNVRYFFYIGGNDSAETAHLLAEQGRAEGYELRAFHVPKTIDNDLLVTDHCPGYGSAARFVALAFMGDDQDNRSLPGSRSTWSWGAKLGFSRPPRRSRASAKATDPIWSIARRSRSTRRSSSPTSTACTESWEGASWP